MLGMGRPSVREQIVEAALERFHTLGFNGCGVQEITDAARVPKGSFYNHFKSKETLLLEVLGRYVAARGLEQLSDPELPPIARMRQHFEALAKRLAAHKFKAGCLLGNLATEMSDSSPEIRAALGHTLGKWSALLTKLLQQAQSEGALARHHDAERLGRFIVDSWEGAVARSKVDKTQAAFDDFFYVVFDTLLRD